MSGLNVLIVGANRGIGLNLVKAFLAKSCNVTGSIRPQTKDDPSFEDLVKTGARVIEIDFLDEQTVIEAASAFGDKQLDILINVGGLPPKPRHWHEQTAEALVDYFRVMTVGPFLTTKHFLPNLEKSTNAKVVNISSGFSSVTDNKFGLFMAYRLAKTALNQQTVTFVREFEKEDRKVILICMEPGFVATRLTNWEAVDDMDTCIAGVVEVIDGLNLADSGSFLNWSGKQLTF